MRIAEQAQEHFPSWLEQEQELPPQVALQAQALAATARLGTNTSDPSSRSPVDRRKILFMWLPSNGVSDSGITVALRLAIQAAALATSTIAVEMTVAGASRTRRAARAALCRRRAARQERQRTQQQHEIGEQVTTSHGNAP